MCFSSSGIDRAKFFMIAQVAYVLNLKPREKSNFSTARIKGHVAIANEFEKVLARTDVPFGNRNHETQVRTDDLVF